MESNGRNSVCGTLSTSLLVLQSEDHLFSFSKKYPQYVIQFFKYSTKETDAHKNIGVSFLRFPIFPLDDWQRTFTSLQQNLTFPPTPQDNHIRTQQSKFSLSILEGLFHYKDCRKCLWGRKVGHDRVTELTWTVVMHVERRHRSLYAWSTNEEKNWWGFRSRWEQAM